MPVHPVWVPGKVLLSLVDELLAKVEAGRLPEGAHLAHVVVDVNNMGEASWLCFATGDRPDAGGVEVWPAVEAGVRVEGTRSVELLSLLEAVLAHLSRYCEEEVCDMMGRVIPWGERTTVDPEEIEYAIDYFRKQPVVDIEAVRKVMKTVNSEAVLRPGEWRQRTAGLCWQARVKLWCKEGQQPVVGRLCAVKVNE